MTLAAERKKGVVILGVPRSGTTLLRRLVDAHPSFACPAETFLLTSAARFLLEEPAADGIGVGALTGLSFAGFSPEEVVRRLRRFVFGFHEEHAARAGKPRWAEKSAYDVFRLKEIELLGGDELQYLCIVRHPLDTLCSLVELVNQTQLWQAELHPYIVRHARPLEALAHAWVDGTRAMLDLVERRPMDAFLLRYEDLVARPGEVMSRAMEHLGEAWSEGLERTALEGSSDYGIGDWKIHAKEHIDGASVGRHKELSRFTIHELAGIVNETAALAGYEPLPEAPRPSRERAKRLLEAAHKLQPLRKR